MLWASLQYSKSDILVLLRFCMFMFSILGNKFIISGSASGLEVLICCQQFVLYGLTFTCLYMCFRLKKFDMSYINRTNASLIEIWIVEVIHINSFITECFLFSPASSTRHVWIIVIN